MAESFSGHVLKARAPALSDVEEDSLGPPES